MKQVLIKPLWDMGLENRLFDNIYPRPMTLWRRAAADLGIALDTWDTVPLDRADCIWLMDLPEKRSTLQEARRRAGLGVPFVLHVMESPLRPHNFVPANQAQCDHVVTYQQNKTGEVSYYSYRLPVTFSRRQVNVPFEERHCAIMVNTNRVEGYFAPRKTGLVGLPGIGQYFSGLKLPWLHCLQPARGELYSWRRKLARKADEMKPDLLTVIGRGWRGEKLSWFPLYPNRPYRCNSTDLHEIPRERKAEVVGGYRFCISVENFRGGHDYISEKIFDALLAGVVPVYLGDENVTQVVPEKAIVDARHFRDHGELLQYLDSCPKTEWEEMRDAGRAFLDTEKARSFSDEAFVERMNRVLLQILEL